MIDEEELLMLLMQRGNYIREIQKLTDDLAEAQSRHDRVSMNLVLEMRQDVLTKCDSNWTAILEMGENGPDDGAEIRRLVRSDPAAEQAENDLEKRIFEVRAKNRTMIDTIREKEVRINAIANTNSSLNRGY